MGTCKKKILTPIDSVSDQMDGTMMVRFSQWQRLLADHPVIEEIVHPSGTEDQKIKPAASRLRIMLENEEYKALLQDL